MSNPARALLEILEPWMGGRETTDVKRGFNENTVTAAERHLVAMKLIWDIRAALSDLQARGLQNIEVYQDASNAWTLTVLAYPNGWVNSGQNGAAVAGARLDMLTALAVLLDGMPVQVNAQQAEGLDGFLDDIVGLLREDDALDPALRRYINDLVAEVRRALSDYRVTGVFDAERAVTNLWVAFEAARAQSKKHKGRWKRAADGLYRPIAAGLIVNLPTLAIEAIQLANG